MGSNTFHLGPTGAGQVGKLVTAMMFHIGSVVTLEALKLSEAYGVPEEQIIELAKVSTGNCWMVQNWGYMDRLIQEHTQGQEQFIHYLVRKDAQDSLIAAKAAKISLPMTGLAYQIYPELLTERIERRKKSKR